MTKELIMKLIEKAKQSSGNAFCPYTNLPVGCALLVEGNIMFGGCNIESSALSSSVDAGEVAIHKAISEGYTKFLAICFFQSDGPPPYPSGKTLQLLAEFNDMIQIIVATEGDFQLHHLYELLPFRPVSSMED